MPAQEQSKQAFFYGWYIVGVGFLSYLVCSFNLSSTLSVFVKPLTEDFGVSRGMFSLLRTGEILIGGVFKSGKGILASALPANLSHQYP